MASKSASSFSLYTVECTKIEARPPSGSRFLPHPTRNLKVVFTTSFQSYELNISYHPTVQRSRSVPEPAQREETIRKSGPSRRLDIQLQAGEEVNIGVFLKQRLGQDKLLGEQKRRITLQSFGLDVGLAESQKINLSFEVKQPLSQSPAVPTAPKLPKQRKIPSLKLLIPSKWGVVRGFVNRMKTVPITSSATRIFALIIGIDNYKHIEKLEGSVHDAQSMESFFLQKMEVPTGHIVTLLDEQATREAILAQFQTHLIDNKEIKQNDAIVIYFAGHGSQVPAPEGWSSDSGLIETLCPYDEGQDPDQPLVHGIPDQTVGKLLRELAEVKGDNITVIFDCCHSGGMTRGAASGQGRARRVQTATPIPATLDASVGGSARGGSSRSASSRGAVKSPNLYGSSSYVLLAACRPEETAFEATASNGKPCGAFTDALLKQLHRVAFDRVTYTELMDSFRDELIQQRPLCDGANRTRLLFNGVGARFNPTTYLVRPAGDGERFNVDAGLVEGVVVGTEFSFPELDVSGPRSPSPKGTEAEQPTVTFVAVSVELASSVLELKEDSKEALGLHSGRSSFPVVVTKWNNNAYLLKVFLEQDDGPDVKLSVIQPKPGHKFIFTNDRKQADILIRRGRDGKVTFRRTDVLLSLYAAVCPPLLIHPPNFANVLGCVAHFNYHLYNTNPLRPLKSLVRLSVQRMQGAPERDKGDNDDDILSEDPERKDVVFEEEVDYGFTISNHSAYDLFPYLFYFDPTTYEIQVWYSPPSPSSQPALERVQAKPSTLLIGHGDQPFEFFPHPELDSDTGFLKLIVSNKYMDLGDRLPQAGIDDLSAPLGMSRRVLAALQRDVWDAWTVPVTVHRKSGT